MCPVMVDEGRGQVLIDSNAIAEYFEETVEGKAMINGTAANRAEIRRLVAWFDQAGFQAGQTIVIQGPGHMGLTCAAYAKSLGAANVIVTGTDEDALRLEVAREVGADHVVDVTVDDPVEVALRWAGAGARWRPACASTWCTTGRR